MAHDYIMRASVLITATAVTLALAACATEPQGVRIINGGTSAVPSRVAEPIRDLVGPEINKAVVGKTFQFTRKGASGFVTYNADGTLSVQEDQKGKSIGKWTVNANQYCETYSVAQPMECGVFKSTGNAYFAANTRIEDLRI